MNCSFENPIREHRLWITPKSADQQVIECKERLFAIGRRHEVTSTARGSTDPACQVGASRALKEITQLLLDNRKLVNSKAEIRLVKVNVKV